MNSQPQFPAAPRESLALSHIFARAMSAFFERYIAAEHTCYPPVPGARYAPVPSPSVLRPADANYTCPECQQVWRRV